MQIIFAIWSKYK